jgi:hypothetical protein
MEAMEVMKVEFTLFFQEETHFLIINLKTLMQIKMVAKVEDIQFC